MKSISGSICRPAGAVCLALTLAATLAPGAPAPAAEKPVFRHPLDDAPIDVTPTRPGDQKSDAVKNFLETGENPLRGDVDALAQGKKLYTVWCQSCHLPTGKGGMGASLIGDEFRYPRVGTEVGMFEVIFAGATGAMQPFGKRMSHEDILRVMAYVRSLKG
jgi:cytochrome c-L